MIHCSVGKDCPTVYLGTQIKKYSEKPPEGGAQSKSKYEPLSLWLKGDGFDANMLPQGLKYYKGHARALSYRGDEENDHEWPIP
jgi:hypothetical protein